MAMIIKYRFLSTEVNHGKEKNPVIKQIFYNVTMDWNEANEEIAKREAYSGEYTIEDDGQPEPEASLPTEERLSAVETKFVAMEAAYGEGVAEA